MRPPVDRHFVTARDEAGAQFLRERLKAAVRCGHAASADNRESQVVPPSSESISAAVIITAATIGLRAE